MKKRIIATVQARMGSSRLPGKPMIEVNNTPILAHLIKRLKLVKQLDGIVVSTSKKKENDIIESFCKSTNINYYRGSEDDVLGRMLESLTENNTDIGVNIFGDCPLIDPNIIEKAIQIHQNNNYDFVSNDLKTTYPPGMEVEVFSIEALKKSSKLTNEAGIREHGTLFIRSNPKIFTLKNFSAPKNHFRPEFEMELDTEEDLKVIQHIFDHFGEQHFNLDDLIKFYENNPDINRINKDVHRRWKQYRL